jgi:hypothetical protein
MTDELEHHVRQALQRRRKSPGVFLYVCIFAAVAGASGYLWLNYDSLAQLFAARSAAAPVAVGTEEPVTQKHLESLRRQTAETLQSIIGDMDTQKANLKNLSDQLSALTTKIDAMQTAGTPAPPQPAAPAGTPVVQRKRLAPRPTGGISVGGAPLPLTPGDNR